MRLPTKKFSLNAYQWFQATPNRALTQAYKAAIAIQNIETEHFDGSKVGTNSTQNSSATIYFQTKINKLLRTIRLRLAEFRFASVIIGDADKTLQPSNSTSTLTLANSEPNPVIQEILHKLTVVDEVLARYSKQIYLPDQQNSKTTDNPNHDKASISVAAQESMFSKSSFIPRSLIKTGVRLNRDLKSSSEAEVIKEHQLSRFRTRRSFQFLALLIIAPILTQQVSKNFLFSPLFNHFQSTKQFQISLNVQQEREAIEELEFFEKKFKFDEVVNKAPRLSSAEHEKMIEEKTLEIAKKNAQSSSSALVNVFSDLVSVGIFSWILFVNPENIRVLKSFLDELVYGLSDSAKAFVIILFTDLFVGFHSAHGWEVIIEAILRHFGLPENRDFIYLFVASFPVILDSTFKYWIFRYLSQISPSAVATYRNMNE